MPDDRHFTTSEMLILGKTQNTRGSEFTAGMRAEITPSSITQALSSGLGKLTAHAMITIGRYQRAVNFMRARIPLLKEGVKRAIPLDKMDVVVVDPAVGFALFGVELANEFPQVQFIDIDIPHVIQTRLERLEKTQLTLPDNLRMIPADLSEEPLSKILNGLCFDVVNLNGAYFSHQELDVTLRYLHSQQSPQGACVVYLPWLPGLDRIRFVVHFFQQHVGSIHGAVRSEEEIHTLFLKAGYPHVTLLFASELAEELHLEGPILDFEVLVIAQKEKPV